MTAALAVRQVGYRQLVRENRPFRMLWLATVVSLFGDWFNTIAVFSLVQELTGSPFAMGLVLSIKMLGFAAASIPAGWAVDRFDRKRLMILSDLSRAVLVLGFILVDQPEHVPLLYVLLAAQVGLGAVFDPAFRATIPNITRPDELVTANALFAATWSTILAIGAAVGGFVTVGLGHDLVFVIDALTYGLSALLLLQASIPKRVAVRTGQGLRAAFVEVVDGWRYLRRNPQIARFAMAKSAWAVGGGALVYLLTQVGEILEPDDFALGVGILFSARGLGTGIGPVVARVFLRDSRKWPPLMGVAVVISGVMYTIIALLPWSYAIIAFIVVAHACSGANWVMSNILLQDRVEDHIRGRVFASEMLILTLIEAVVTLTSAVALEAGWLDLRSSIILFAGLQIAAGALWLATSRGLGDQPDRTEQA